MNDIEIRLACLRLAVDQPGNPNTVSEAEKFYEFAMQSEKTDAAAKEASETKSTTAKPATPKKVK